MTYVNDAEETTYKAERILAAVNAAAEKFLRAGSLEDASVEQVLEAFGQATDVDRVYVFENGTLADGTLVTSQRFEWTAADVASQMGNPDLHDFPWREGGMERWEETLSAGNPVSGPVRNFPASEKKILEPQGIMSILVVPVVVRDKWWGFIGFDECEHEREWSTSEIDALESAAAMFGALIERRAHEATDREKYLASLQDSEEKYRTLVEQSLQGILVIQDGRIVFTNSAMTRITDYSAEELKSLSTKDLMALVHPDDYEMTWGRLQRRLAGEQVPPVYVVRGVRKDGEMFWLQLFAKLIDFEGKPAIQATLVDITDRKKMEEELARVQKLESIGVLAGGISHDFNNLLLAILGNISLARMATDPASEAHSMLQNAEKACRRAEVLTQQLLTFSRGGEPLRKSASLVGILHEAADLAVSGSKVRCTFDLPDDLWPAEVDEGQIAQVISNLVINADQAMPEGGIVEVSARNLSVLDDQRLPLQPGRYVQIGIRDMGIGITEDHLRRIFDPYFTTKNQGSGLGLAVAFSIVSKHGGHIMAESNIGKGSSFSVYLPATEPQTIAEKSDDKRPAFSGARILVMDDDDMIRQLVENVLTRSGYEITTVPGGTEVIEQVEKAISDGNPFDLVILDLTVPGGMGGKEARDRLLEIAPDLPAIVSSGYSSDLVLSEYRTHGFDGYVAKPYLPWELRRQVDEVLSRKINS